MLKHYKREHTRICDISSSLEGQEIIVSSWG